MIYILASLLPCYFALKILKSQVELDENPRISGLYFIRETSKSLILSNSLTCCVRFNFQRLGESHLAGILTIHNSKSNAEFPDFLRIYAKYPYTWLNFGNDESGAGFKSSWLLEDTFKDTYFFWRTNIWHHICFSYAKSTSHVILIKVKIWLI